MQNKRALHFLQRCARRNTSYLALELFYLGERIMRHRNAALFLLLSFLLATAAWGREDRLTNTGTAPAAEGKIITDNDRNGNTGIDIEVKHMATPQSLTPARQTYLVWVQPRGKDPELLGALRVNEKLEGSLKAATTYKTFDVIITAEDNVKPDTPSSTVILKGTVERK
jgi:hypothetical protein